MPDSQKMLHIKPFEDHRGKLKKILVKSMLKEDQEIQEVYVLYSNKDTIRGNHYHKHTIEYFTVISGEAIMALGDTSLNNIEYIKMKADDNLIIKVEPLTVHAIKNESEEPLIMLAVSLKEYTSSDTDTYQINII